MRLDTAKPAGIGHFRRRTSQTRRTAMTVIALILAGNLLLAGLFSLVAVAFD